MINNNKQNVNKKLKQYKKQTIDKQMILCQNKQMKY